VLTSSDGGRTWAAQRPPAGVGTLAGVFFVDAGHGWTVGNGAVSGTSDGGKRWRRVAVLPGVSFEDIGFADRRRGWAVGRSAGHAVVYATTDGGRNWRRRLATGTGILSSVDVVDASDIYAAGSASPATGGRALLVGTTNGGRSWRRIAVPNATSIGGLHFATPSEGWISLASGIGGEIRHTRDGGRGWTTQTRRDLFAAGRLAFYGRNDGWMIGSFGLFVTTDGGRRNGSG
jgi:photosystem II stability/assembly factor-like uncharacterized protein